MSRNYAALRGKIGSNERRTLLKEQRMWLTSRDRDCLAKYDRREGTAGPLDIALCWVRVTQERAHELKARLNLASLGKGGALSPAAFIGRWRGGEGTYLKIRRSGARFTIENQSGLDADTRGIYAGTLTARGLTFRRNGILETIRPSKGDAIRQSALRGKSDCLMVSRDEGYCRY